VWIIKSAEYSILMLIMGITLASFALVQGSLSESLETKYQIGSGPNDWWLAYPDGSSTSSTTMEHPSWVLDALEFNPVVIYVHKGCSYCRPQTEAMGEVVNKYGDSFVYFDVPADGSDARSEEAVSTYDPNGGVPYVPVTAIVTLAPGSDGKVQAIWHSTDEITGKAWIENYVQDAISYHNEYSADWKRSEA
jgi:thiol-disulfide isomerase/thioredoxin